MLLLLVVAYVILVVACAHPRSQTGGERGDIALQKNIWQQQKRNKISCAVLLSATYDVYLVSV
jgi:hypothetical protein